jgi:hypothetical protein
VNKNNETAQVPGGRFGGHDQKGSLMCRSFLCAESALHPQLPARPCDSISGLSELLFEGCLVEAMFHLGIPLLCERGHLLIQIQAIAAAVMYSISQFNFLSVSLGIGLLVLWCFQRTPLSREEARTLDCSEEEEALSDTQLRSCGEYVAQVLPLRPEAVFCN